MTYVGCMEIKHVLSADQFTRDDLDKILARSYEMESIITAGGSKMCKGKILGALFYEPSTPVSYTHLTLPTNREV